MLNEILKALWLRIHFHSFKFIYPKTLELLLCLFVCFVLMILSDLRCSEDFHDSEAAGASHASWECKPAAEDEKAQTLKKVGMCSNRWKTGQQLRVGRTCGTVGRAATMHTILVR